MTIMADFHALLFYGLISMSLTRILGYLLIAFMLYINIHKLRNGLITFSIWESFREKGPSVYYKKA